MPNEASKLRERWKREGLWNKYFGRCGSDDSDARTRVLDIGCGDDRIVPEAVGWEYDSHGNGQFLESLPDASFDIVFSSHFLEHAADPLEAILNQWRVLKPGGHIIFAIPEEDLYEQGIFPPMWNNDHKFTWSIHKDVSWSPAPKNVTDIIRWLPNHKVISMRIIDEGYHHGEHVGEWVDHTERYGAEAAIEVIIEKMLAQPEPRGVIRKIFRCPKCSKIQFIIRGIDVENRFTGYCSSCGQTGWFAVPDSGDLPVAEPGGTEI